MTPRQDQPRYDDEPLWDDDATHARKARVILACIAVAAVGGVAWLCTH